MPTTPAPRVALYLDTPLSNGLIEQLIERCRDLGASLLCLAPPPHNLAVSRLEPHLDALEQAGTTWDLLATEDDLTQSLQDLPGIALLVCDSHSALAHHRGKLPAPLLILLHPDPALTHATADPAHTVDWLAPRLNRGF